MRTNDCVRTSLKRFRALPDRLHHRGEDRFLVGNFLRSWCSVGARGLLRPRHGTRSLSGGRGAGRKELRVALSDLLA